MPRYVASISEMLTMPVGVLTTDYIDVWCNTLQLTLEFLHTATDSRLVSRRSQQRSITAAEESSWALVVVCEQAIDKPSRQQCRLRQQLL